MAGAGWQVQADQEVDLQSTIAIPALSWFYVTWRARVLQGSTGNIPQRLEVVAHALGHVEHVGGRPKAQMLRSDGVSFEFWYEALSAHQAWGGARVALRQAFRSVGVGDPTPQPGAQNADVMLMLEELPALNQGDS